MEILGSVDADSSLLAIVAIEETDRLARAIQVEAANWLSVVVIEQDPAVRLDVTQRQSFGIDDRVKDGLDRVEAFALFVCRDNCRLVRGVPGDWRDLWDDPDDSAELRAKAEAAERPQTARVQRLGRSWRAWIAAETSARDRWVDSGTIDA
jgi:hypothetical protein